MLTETDRLRRTKLKCEYKRIAQRKKRQHHVNIANKLDALNDKDPQTYWKFWKSLNKRNLPSNVIDIATFTEYYKNTCQTTNNDGFMNDFMKTVDTFVKYCPDNYQLVANDPLNEILNCPISVEEVTAAMKRMKIENQRVQT